MIKVYVAGAYGDPYILNVFSNMKIGIETCAYLSVLGFAPYCPWIDYQYFLSKHGDMIEEKRIKEISMEWLRVSDAVLIVNNKRNENSKGTKAEIEEAKRLKIPVFNSKDELVSFKIEQEKKGS